MALKSMGVKGFKSIRELEFEVRDLNVLIGANGSGKSNFIQLFALLNAIIEQRLGAYSAQAGAENLLYFGSKQTSSIHLDLRFDGQRLSLENGYSCTLVANDEDKLTFQREYTFLHDRERYGAGRKKLISSDAAETQLFVVSERTNVRNEADYIIEALRSWRVYHFHDTSSSAQVKKTGHIDDNEALRADASNLAAFLYRLRETQVPYYQRIVAAVQSVAPFFADFRLRPNPLNPDTIRLEWREKGSDSYFNANMLSDGTLRYICLATLLLQPVYPSVIVIDEPELGLHPYAIQRLMGLLRTAAASTQVIVSTQSVPLVNQCMPEDLVIVEREDAQSIFRRLQPDALDTWLEEYALGDAWEKNLLGGRP
ncbi:MAG: AAA family ATPase [Chloroflexota bacterium]|nr:AAA family ATPase [Chloroflexota bacterium]